MKPMIAVLSVLTVTLFAAFRFAPTERAGFDPGQVETEVLKVMDVYLAGFNELDMAKIASTMHSDHMTFPYLGRILDKPLFAETLEGWVKNKAGWDGTWLDSDVRVISEDLAVYSGTYSTTMTMEDGEKRLYAKSGMATLLERTADGWKLSLIGAGSGGYEVVN